MLCVLELRQQIQLVSRGQMQQKIAIQNHFNHTLFRISNWPTKPFPDSSPLFLFDLLSFLSAQTSFSVQLAAATLTLRQRSRLLPTQLEKLDVYDFLDLCDLPQKHRLSKACVSIYA